MWVNIPYMDDMGFEWFLFVCVCWKYLKRHQLHCTTFLWIWFIISRRTLWYFSWKNIEPAKLVHCTEIENDVFYSHTESAGERFFPTTAVVCQNRANTQISGEHCWLMVRDKHTDPDKTWILKIIQLKRKVIWTKPPCLGSKCECSSL